MKFFSQTKLINLLLIAGMIILTVCGIQTYKEMQDLAAANNRIVHTHKVVEESDLTLLSLLDAESRVNFYVLMNDKSILQDLPKLIKNIRENFLFLKQLTKDNPIQTVRVNALEKLINTKIAIMQKMMQLDVTKDKPIILQLAISTERLSLKKQISQLSSAINQEEENLLEQRNNQALYELKASNVMLIVFGVLSELFIILSLILLNYNVHQRNIAERKQAKAENELKLTNKNLQESEERYLLATEGSAAGLWDWKVGTDSIFFSSYFRKMLGYTEKEFPNSLQSFEKVIHPHDHDKVWELVNKHFKYHVPYNIEYRLRAKSGKYIWFQATGQALWDKQGIPTRMSGSIVNIEDRKKAEQRLNIQHAVAAILSEASSLEEVSVKLIQVVCENLGWACGSIWMLNVETNLLECAGAWYEASPLLKMFEEETSKKKFEYGVGFPGRVWKAKEPLWFADIDKDKNYSRADIAKKVGLHSALGFPIIVQKEVLGAIECYTTENESPDYQILDLMSTIGSQIGQFIRRRSAENDLRESEAYKTAILQAASDSIVTIDAQKNILLFNPQTTKVFNFKEKELINKNIQMILPDFDLKVAESEDQSVVEMLGERRDGERFPVEIKLSKMIIENETMFVIIIRDITDRKKIEKMKNEFVSVVSHELRTPITSIRGALGLVLGNAVGTIPEKAKKLLDLANNNCERLLLLINDILDIEKLEAGKMNFEFQVIDINQLVNEAIAANKMFADKYGVRLTLTQTEANLKVNADPSRLMQVLTNLISNAVKFSPKGEEVTLTVKQLKDDVRVLVSNKGEGIPLEFQSHIFQKFSQADASNTRGKGGTGLGLNISKAIVEKLAGTLNFISKPGEITTFYFDLPLWRETQKIISDQKAKSEYSQDKILICEDDEDQANYLTKLLESAGFRIDVANTVGEAKRLLEKNNYHVLLLDLILPDQDGISFIRELRNNEKTRSLPIIVLSIIAQTGKTLLNGEVFSVIDWLDKPIDFDKLLRTIDHIKKKTHPKIPSVLHVEDDLETFAVVKTLLEQHANVISATTLQETVKKLKESKFDLVILDLLLPDGNAEQLLPLISEYKLPVIVYSTLKFDKNLSQIVKHSLVKSETTSEELLSLIKHVLETSP